VVSGKIQLGNTDKFDGIEVDMSYSQLNIPAGREMHGLKIKAPPDLIFLFALIYATWWPPKVTDSIQPMMPYDYSPFRIKLHRLSIICFSISNMQSEKSVCV